jgi:hypothetical protein
MNMNLIVPVAMAVNNMVICGVQVVQAAMTYVHWRCSWDCRIRVQGEEGKL